MSAPLSDKIPTINAMFRLQWEEAQASFVLLYPEGMVQLNGPAGEILSLVDGQNSVAQIIALLQKKFPEADDLAEDVLAFLREAQQNQWLSLV